MGCQGLTNSLVQTRDVNRLRRGSFLSLKDDLDAGRIEALLPRTYVHAGDHEAERCVNLI